MASIAVFPGSFDPITLGHVDIVQRAAGLFDKVVIAIGQNTTKNYVFSQEKRLKMAEEVFRGNTNVEITGFNELTVNLCRKLGATYLLRGLRSATDFDYEKGIAFMNSSLAPEIETVFLMTKPEYAGISSTIVREIYRYGGDISAFVPAAAMKVIEKR
jgi:pantetheine-phosphate adenylyltransferase